MQIMGKQRSINHVRSLSFILLGSFLLYALYWCLMLWYYDDWKKGADFGNAFGAASALFSGLAFGVLIFTLHLQQKALSAAYDGLRQATDAQGKSEVALKKQIDEMGRALEQSRKNMESELLLKLFETYRASRERHLDYPSPELLWSWAEFDKKYPSQAEKERSYTWRYLADYGGFFEFCGILVKLGYVGEDFIRILPRAEPLWNDAQEIIRGMRTKEGSGLWDSWEYFAARQYNIKQQDELARSQFDD